MSFFEPPFDNPWKQGGRLVQIIPAGIQSDPVR
jgi:hypothetical protein